MATSPRVDLIVELIALRAYEHRYTDYDTYAVRGQRILTQLADGTAVQPTLGPLVDGDLCDLVVGGLGRGRRYCHAPAVREARDADGSTRLLCERHTAELFPTRPVTAGGAA